MINIKTYKADEGDAFLISFGIEKDINIVIDMGLENTYKDYIKTDLENLKQLNRKIDLLVITHVDIDHINGAIPFIIDNGFERSIIEVSEVWHNTYRHLQFSKEKTDKISVKEQNALKSLILQNKSSLENGLSEIKVEEGLAFGSSLIKYKYDWNKSFNNKAVCFENEIKTDLPLKFIIVSPNIKKLNALASHWLSKLDDLIYDFKISDENIFDDAFEFYMQNEKESEVVLTNIGIETEFNIEELAQIEKNDDSPINGSSISFIIEYKNKKMLFLGDSHEDIIFENLKKLKENDYELDFDLVKISHHGSYRNTSNRLIELFNSRYYLISTNGLKYRHPNIETIAKILLKKSDICKTLIFNYEHDKIKIFDKPELKSKYNYDIVYKTNIELL